MGLTDMDTFLVTFLSVIIATFVLIIIWFKRRYSHWKNLGLAYIEPSIPFGNFGDSFWQKISEADWYVNFYRQMRARKLKHAGTYFFHKPAYIPLDLDLIKRIMQTDFQHFTDRGEVVSEKEDPLSAHVFALAGQKWRNLRVKLTPTFTSGKMKTMYPIIVKISEELVKTLTKECEIGEPIDVKDISARFTTDVIGNCAFGIECNSLKDPNTEFRVYGKRIANLTQKELIINFLAFLFPSMAKFLGTRIVPKSVSDFFWNVIKTTVEYRTKNGVRRNDALQLLMDMMKQEGNSSEDSLTFSELAAQAFVFFAAGFETSSTLMSFALIELAANQEIQDKLREEINSVLGGSSGELSYEAIHDMRYLDMVISGKFVWLL